MFLYNLGIRLYRVAIFVASFFNPKAKLWIAGRKDWTAPLKKLEPNKTTVWFHTASLGEYEQAKPVIEKLKAKEPNLQILVSFFSPSGYQVRKNETLPDAICYMPLDTKANAKKFLELANPQLAVFVRYEFWPNFLDELNLRNISTTIISAHFRPNQFIFKPLGKFVLKRLLRLNTIVVQYASSQNVLLSNGFTQAQTLVCGDSRIDRVIEIASQKLENPVLEAFVQDKKVLILGSSYTDEEAFTFPLMEKEKDLKIIIAPHYIEENNLRRIEGSLPVKAVRYTEAVENDELKNAQVLILDTMGMLASIYQYGYFALVGGGFKDGIHSILEPAAHGLPLFFGPHHKSFPEAQGLIEAKGAFMVETQTNFLNNFLPLLKSDGLRQQTGQHVLNFVQSHSGASQLIVNQLERLLKL